MSLFVCACVRACARVRACVRVCFISVPHLAVSTAGAASGDSRLTAVNCREEHHKASRTYHQSLYFKLHYTSCT